MKTCSICKQSGHNKRSCGKPHDPENTKTRESKCFKNGNEYEKSINEKLKTLRYKENSIVCGETAGASHNRDIVLRFLNPEGVDVGIEVGIEAKNLGAFEGGCVKLNKTEEGMKITEPCIHRDIVGDTVLYNGQILPWYENKRTLSDWEAVKDIFKGDVYITAPSDAISKYYAEKGTSYIQIQGMGLYHTGADILELGVPKFDCEVNLRIRSTKHIKHGIPRDITAGLQFNRKTLVKSPFSLDGCLPAGFQIMEPVVE
jgi:hypothetical protein